MLLDDLATYLVAQGYLTPIQKGTLIELPDTCMALRETGGFPSEHTMGGGAGDAVLDQPTVQVVTRAKDYVTAMVAARTAHAMLDGAKNYSVLGEEKFMLVTATQSPFFLMRDENQRFLCAFNVQVQRHSSVA